MNQDNAPTTPPFGTRDIPYLILLCVLTASVFLPYLTGTWAFYDLDSRYIHYPLRHFLYSEIKQGRLPLWCPHIRCGYPVHAYGEGGLFYLPNLPLYLLLPAHRANDISVILHLVAAAAFMYLFLRTAGAGPWPSLIGGFSFAFCGFNIAHLGNINSTNAICWLPLALFLLCRSQSGAHAALAGVASGVGLLAGRPDVGIFSVMVCAGWIIFCSGKSRASSIIGRLALYAVFACGIYAVQALPTIELTLQSARYAGYGYEEATFGSFNPKHVFSLLLPVTDSNWTSGVRSEFLGYPGAFSLLGALALLVTPRLWEKRKRMLCFLFGCMFVSVLLALGRYNPFYRLITLVPPFSLFRVPARFIFIFGFSACALSAFFLDGLLNSREKTGAGIITRIAAVGLIIVAVAAFSAEAYLASYGTFRADITFFAVFTGMFLFVLAAFSAGAVGKEVLLAAVLCLAVPGAFRFVTVNTEHTPPREYAAEPEVASFLKASDPASRFLVLERGDEFKLAMSRAKDTYEPLLPNLGVRYGLNHLDGYGALSTERFEKFRASMDRRMLDLTGTRYIVSKHAAPFEDMHKVLDSSLAVYENPGALPRVFTVKKVILAQSSDVLDRMKEPGFDPRETAIVETDDETEIGAYALYADAGAELAVTSYEPSRVEIKSSSPSGAFMVLTDTYYPGWKAFIDGKRAAIHRTDYLFRGIDVPAGEHTVEFTYSPASFWAGAAISILTLLALALTKKGTGYFFWGLAHLRDSYGRSSSCR